MTEYQKFIQNIIDTRGQWDIPEGQYYENHHIIPRCMGGEPVDYEHNTKHPNLIWLTKQEHFEAHKLLADETSDNRLIYAAWSLYNYDNDVANNEQYNQIKLSQAKAAQEKFGNKILCLDNGKVYNSAHEIVRELGLSLGNISGCCHGTRRHVNGYHFVFADRFEQDEDYKINILKFQESKSKHYRKVECLDTGEKFDMIKEAAEAYGTIPASITDCCAGRRATCHKKYHWRYIDE